MVGRVRISRKARMMAMIAGGESGGGEAVDVWGVCFVGFVSCERTAGDGEAVEMEVELTTRVRVFECEEVVEARSTAPTPCSSSKR
jgi:hypothetical protein